jgi:hypothetical protein
MTTCAALRLVIAISQREGRVMVSLDVSPPAFSKLCQHPAPLTAMDNRTLRGDFLLARTASCVKLSHPLTRNKGRTVPLAPDVIG